jgi:hypothetical protein
MRGSLQGKGVFGGDPHDHAAAIEGRLVAFILIHGVSSITVDAKNNTLARYPIIPSPARIASADTNPVVTSIACRNSFSVADISERASRGNGWRPAKRCSSRRDRAIA